MWLKLTWRNLWRHPKRTLILLAVFTLGLLTMLFFQSLMQAWSKSMLDTALDNLNDPIQMHHAAYRENPIVDHHFLPSEALVAHLNQPSTLDKWMWTARVRVPAMLQSEYGSLPITLIGIEPKQESTLSFIGEALVEGQGLLEHPKGLLVGQQLLSRLETQLNRRVVLRAQGAQQTLRERGIRITGTYRHADPRIEQNWVFVEVNLADRFLQLQGQRHEIVLHPKLGLALEPEQSKTQLTQMVVTLQALEPTLAVSPWWVSQPMIETSQQMMDSFIWVWLGFVMLLMLLGMLNTLMMSLYERQAEFSLLHRLGMSQTRIRAILLFELLGLFLLAMGLALLFTLGLVSWGASGLNLTAYAEGAAWFGMGHQLYLRPDWAKWIEVLGVSLLAMLLVGIGPIWRATCQSRLVGRGG